MMVIVYITMTHYENRGTGIGAAEAHGSAPSHPVQMPVTTTAIRAQDHSITTVLAVYPAFRVMSAPLPIAIPNPWQPLINPFYTSITLRQVIFIVDRKNIFYSFMYTCQEIPFIHSCLR